MNRKPFLVLGANVLIDLYTSDSTIIRLINSFIGQLILPEPVLSEVRSINKVDCSELGIVLVEPKLEQVMQAASGKGALSFQDNLCLILAKDNGWTCVTNDKLLRQRCEIENIPIFWGVELICVLVERGGLSPNQAREILLKIQKINPRYITDNIIRQALKKIGL